MEQLTVERLISACGDAAAAGAIVIDAELVPTGGHGTPVSPAGYEGGRFQRDRRWEAPDAAEPTPVIVIDNVPSQANRLEAALEAEADALGLPRLVLDLTVSGLAHIPPHVPRELSSLRWPHRNADAYLRDSLLDGAVFDRTELGKAILGATASAAGPLVAWFPQALLLGFWQSHLGSKRSQAKHARAWVSEIVGWGPGSGDGETRTLGVKGDPVNIGDVGKTAHKAEDLLAGWDVDPSKKAGKKDKMSGLGHGQVPFEKGSEALAPVSFRRITQRASLSFAQLRRVCLGTGHDSAQDEAARALVAAVGLHAHQSAFGRPFALRSRADLSVDSAAVRLDSTSIDLGDTGVLLADTLEMARSRGVPMDGWGAEPVRLVPNASLVKAIGATWPNLDAEPDSESEG